MRIPPAVRQVLPLVVLPVLLLGACSTGSERAQPTAGAATSSTPTATATTAPHALDQQQVDAALLTQADMPTGWLQDTSAPVRPAPDASAPAEVVYDPPACAEIAAAIDDDTPTDRQPLAAGEATFATDGFTFLVETVETWEPDLRTASVDALAAALSACPSYTQTAPDGTVTTTTVTALDAPNLADRTVGVRVAASSGTSPTIVVDVVVVVTGSTSVSVVAGGLTPVDPEVLQQVVATAVLKVATA